MSKLENFDTTLLSVCMWVILEGVGWYILSIARELSLKTIERIVWCFEHAIGIVYHPLSGVFERIFCTEAHWSKSGDPGRHEAMDPQVWNFLGSCFEAYED